MNTVVNDIDHQLPGTSTEIAARLDVIKTMIVKGMAQQDIVNECHDKNGWNVSKRQIRRYCLKARAMLTSEFMKTSYATKMALAEHRFVNIYQQALAAGDFAQARLANIAYVQLQKEIALHRLDVPKQVERKALEAGMTLDYVMDQLERSEGLTPNVITTTNTSVLG